jgi:hypothetical protein
MPENANEQKQFSCEWCGLLIVHRLDMRKTLNSNFGSVSKILRQIVSYRNLYALKEKIVAGNLDKRLVMKIVAMADWWEAVEYLLDDCGGADKGFGFAKDCNLYELVGGNDCREIFLNLVARFQDAEGKLAASNCFDRALNATHNSRMRVVLWGLDNGFERELSVLVNPAISSGSVGLFDWIIDKAVERKSKGTLVTIVFSSCLARSELFLTKIINVLDSCKLTMDPKLVHDLAMKVLDGSVLIMRHQFTEVFLNWSDFKKLLPIHGTEYLHLAISNGSSFILNKLIKAGVKPTADVINELAVKYFDSMPSGDGVLRSQEKRQLTDIFEHQLDLVIQASGDAWKGVTDKRAARGLIALFGKDSPRGIEMSTLLFLME